MGRSVSHNRTRDAIAPLPPGVSGHFRPELRRFVLMQYHQGQVTVPRLMAMLQAIGMDISNTNRPDC